MSTDTSKDGGPLAPRQRERRALSYSLVCSIVLAVSALVVGVVTGIRIIVFDGAYMAIGLILSWASLQAARAAAAGPTRRFPFGRDALAPLMVVIQGLALAGTLVLAFGDALVVIRDGGSDMNVVIVSSYGFITGMTGFVIAWWLRKTAQGSDLVAAEIAQWKAGSVLSVIMVAGAVVVAVLALTPLREVARFADPFLVIIACVVLAAVPVRLVRGGVNELLEGAPPPKLAASIATVIESVRSDFDLPDPIVRAGKVGQKIYVEVDFVVPPDAWSVSEEDRVRRAIIDRLLPLEFEVWAYVAVTSDESLAY
ncbi:cation transporter [Leucobacter coleopterorum]|uniref:Cation transporter n=1 Tax=Leucobacter coleopterorum TaxID=2714933 RepID=A0ABX6JTT2_9MICO|nr:cation transporter [Leucobacter coleopterorum]QIM17697.1 cation transporter [Leucobacter coleopterorum]